MSNKPSKKDESEHYVNNKEFCSAVVKYVGRVSAAKESGEEVPVITEYIGSCFLKIAEGLSRKPNYIRYTFREEMVMDAVENCIKAINNYDVSKPTRTGKPNPFGYFTQISYYAFLRRIEKENKQQDIKELYMEVAGLDSFGNFNDNDDLGRSIVEKVRNRSETIRNRDRKIKAFGKKMRNAKSVSSGGSGGTLEAFLDE